MSREIKFRVWDKRYKQFIDSKNYEVDEIIFVWTPSGILIAPDYFNDIVIQQFTGLLDKNGKEIYEGDVLHAVIDISIKGDDEVRFTDGLTVVEWSDDHNGFICHWGNNTDKLSDYEIKEVVGNIFQNPELLKS